jgi:SAM-dependent methyltransferase
LAWQLNTAEAWIGREVFYEGRAASRSRETERFYQRLVRRYCSFLVPTGATVLEMGCGLGDLLAEVRPARGVGVDFSPRTVALARQRHPECEFQIGDAATWWPPTPAPAGQFAAELLLSGVEEPTANCQGFDYILLADLINDLPDVQAVFEHVRDLSHARTRLVLNFLNTLWRPALAAAEWVGAKAPSLPQNWLSTADVKNLLLLAGWEVIREEHRIMWPVRTPLLAAFLNRWVAPLVPAFCLTIFLVARPRPAQAAEIHRAGASERRTPRTPDPCRQFPGPSVSVSSAAPALQHSSTPLPRGEHFTCSVIVPARNEAGNIEDAVRRIPELGLGTELIFVEGHSTDDTWEEIQRAAMRHPERNIKLLKQRSTGKGGAVREGFAAATGDLLFILDADLTMPPEELPKFYEIACNGTAEFVNGVRLVYPMEHEAMRFLNMAANKAFGVAFSWLLGQHLKDTLCGTKVLFRADYERLQRNRAYFGEFDPFGDFDLLFGAAKLNLRMIDLPVRYHARTYGKTNIRRWRHGWLLLRMVLFAAGRLKFV